MDRLWWVWYKWRVRFLIFLRQIDNKSLRPRQVQLSSRWHWPLAWLVSTFDISEMSTKSLRPSKVYLGSKLTFKILTWLDEHDFQVITLLTLHISFRYPIDMVFHLRWVIKYMATNKLTKLGTLFVVLIIDSKLLNKLPKCMLVFFSLFYWAKCPTKIHEHVFFPYITLFLPIYS